MKTQEDHEIPLEYVQLSEGAAAKYLLYDFWTIEEGAYILGGIDPAMVDFFGEPSVFGWKSDVLEILTLASRSLGAEKLKTIYEYPDFSFKAFHVEPIEFIKWAVTKRVASAEKLLAQLDSDRQREKGRKIKSSTTDKTKCQALAEFFWTQDSATTIKNMIDNDAIQNIGGAKHYETRTVRLWISEVAPEHIRKGGWPRE